MHIKYDISELLKKIEHMTELNNNVEVVSLHFWCHVFLRLKLDK